jgi:Cu/Ag efflux pump CusA
MIRALVDFALNHRFFIIAAAVLLMIWGAVSFHNLPVDAYPDVANNYVQIITQWPGRAAEEIEQQVTIPLELVVNGIPHLEHLRSTSMFGLSSVMLIFEDNSDNNWNRQKVQERLSQAELPDDLNLLVHRGKHQSSIRFDGAQIDRGLGVKKTLSVCAERGGRVWPGRPDQRIPGSDRPRQARFLRT